jgi:hypothetical protein
VAAIRLLGLLLVSAPAVTLAAALDYLARDELLCAPAGSPCIRGTLTFERNERLLRLRGRVTSASGPGLLIITVTGTSRLGQRHYAPMEIEIRGRPTEIVDFRMIPDHPGVYRWALDGVRFIAQP